MNAPVIAHITGSTCGDACWHAVEDVCHCSCGGKNHGCLRDASGLQPVRAARIGGVMMKLRAVGSERDLWQDASKAAGYNGAFVHRSLLAPMVLKAASKKQIEAWPELSAYRVMDVSSPVTALLWEPMAETVCAP